MRTRTFKPSPRYLTRMRLVITLVALLILAGGMLCGLVIGLDDGIGSTLVIFLVTAFVDVAWWIPAMLLTGPYYRSLNYEIQDDEIIVRVGIWTKSIKHVPYRTVTNQTVKRDVLDRLLGLGTLNIQTAGMSGQSGYEERLRGLPNVQEVYDMVSTELRRFRGGMTPTAAGVETGSAPTSSDALEAILAELRAIRQALETQH